MTVKHHVSLLRRNCLNTPGIGANRHRVEAGEVDRRRVAPVRFIRNPAAWLLGQFGVGPAGVEQNDITLAEFDTVGLRRRLDISGVDHVPGIHGRDPEMPCHVDHTPSARPVVEHRESRAFSAR